ncbi:hypothetical protein [Streptomyces chartreusis]|uniref:hypothetical protein n=1 Tax=Streptomyces chartreusis TaxID=1969 RepID=UPI002E19BE55
MSVDPCFALSAPDLRIVVERDRELARRWVTARPQRFPVDSGGSWIQHDEWRCAAENVLADLRLEMPRRRGCYVAASLPRLPFRDGAFALALSGHFLFTYADRLSSAFHRAALRELLRVAEEVRVYPLRTHLDESAAWHPCLAEYLPGSGVRGQIVVVQPQSDQADRHMLMLSRVGRGRSAGGCPGG